MPGSSKRHSTPHTSQHIVRDYLRDAILDGTFPPGTPIRIQDVAEGLDVPPVAAMLAITNLMTRGLIVNTARDDSFDLQVVTPTQTEGDDAIRTLHHLAARLSSHNPGALDHLGRLIRSLVGNTAPDTACALGKALTDAAEANPDEQLTAADVAAWDGLLFMARFARPCDIAEAETAGQIKAVTDALREAIFAGTHTPGRALTPALLATSYDAPQDHLAEALQILEGTGLVETSTGVHRAIDPNPAECQGAVRALELMARVLSGDDAELGCITDTLHHAIGTTDTQTREVLEFTLRDAAGHSTPRPFSQACLQGLDGLIYRATRATRPS